MHATHAIPASPSQLGPARTRPTRWSWFRRRIAVPGEHGSWVLFLSPLVLGVWAGGALPVATAYLLVAATAGFLLRQPITALVKVRSGTRPASDVPAACFWIAIYSLLAGLHVLGLVLRGFGSILVLALPAVLIMGWYVALVGRRAQRHQPGVELLGAGALSLAAPAAMWIGLGWADPRGWLLWVLVWAASAASIASTHVQLEQRTWTEPRPLRTRLHTGRSALIGAAALPLGVAVLAASGLVPALLVMPYLILAAETLQSVLRPARGRRPRQIGVRQLTTNVLFTVAFLLTWHGLDVAP